MKRSSLTIFLLVAVSLACPAPGRCGEPLGLPRFGPSADQPVGWRGDGTGRYPGATPPLVWERRGRTPLEDLRCQARAPAEGGTERGIPLAAGKGQGACHYGLTAFLVLGPLPSAEKGPEPLEQKQLPGEADLAPRKGEQAGAWTWQEAHGPDVNLSRLLGRAKQRQVVYVCTWVHAPRESKAGLRVKGLDYGLRFRAWLNGRPASAWDGERHTLRRGWNRLVLKVQSPGGADDWIFRASLFAFAQDVRYETKNIAWTTPLPGPSFATPVLVGDRLLVTSEPSDLLCLDRHTGRVLWLRSHPTWATLSAAQRQEMEGHAAVAALAARLDKLNAAYLDLPTSRDQEERRRLVHDMNERVRQADGKYRVSLGWGGGNCAPTPCSDGKVVYVWHGETGVLVCCGLDGKERWVRFHHPGKGGEHGISSSPVLIGDRVVVLAGHCVIAFDRHSGAECWRQRYRHPCYPTLVAARVGNSDVVVAADGSVYRVTDGKILQGPFGRDDGECASAVVDGERFYLISRNGFCAARLPRRGEGDTRATILNRIPPEKLKPTETYPVGSPLCHEGLVYATHSGWGARDEGQLYVIDPLADRPVFTHKLDFYPALFYDPKGAGIAASLVLAGKYLYVMDNRGTTIVFEPGRTYRQVAKNTIEHIADHSNAQEVTQSTPIFQGGSMYYRAEQNLYCVGAP